MCLVEALLEVLHAAHLPGRRGVIVDLTPMLSVFLNVSFRLPRGDL